MRSIGFHKETEMDKARTKNTKKTLTKDFNYVYNKKHKNFMKSTAMKRNSRTVPIQREKIIC